jgi:NitT/TauT family transport system substrate-binding protein
MTEAFHDANPKIAAAVLSAVDEASKLIHSDPQRAAEIYIEVSGDKKSNLDSIVKTLETPGVVYETVPRGLLKVADFMYRTGTLVEKPSSYDDILFKEAPRP